jgi:hypothetical protein
MDQEQLVRRASEGDKLAFVDLTRHFQLVAFGSALLTSRLGREHAAIMERPPPSVSFASAWLAV